MWAAVFEWRGGTINPIELRRFNPQTGYIAPARVEIDQLKELSEKQSGDTSSDYIADASPVTTEDSKTPRTDDVDPQNDSGIEEQAGQKSIRRVVIKTHLLKWCESTGFENGG